MKRSEKRKSLKKVRESRIEETLNPSLTAMSIREDNTRAKSVNTQTNPSVNLSIHRDPEDNLLGGSSSTPQVILPINEVLSRDNSPPQSAVLKPNLAKPPDHAEAEYMVPTHARRGREDGSHLQLSSEAYESVDYS